MNFVMIRELTVGGVDLHGGFVMKWFLLLCCLSLAGCRVASGVYVEKDTFSGHTDIPDTHSRVEFSLSEEWRK